jgi:hypothetical protein
VRHIIESRDKAVNLMKIAPFALDEHRRKTEYLEECEGDAFYWIDEEGNYEFLPDKEVIGVNGRQCQCCEFQFMLYQNFMHWNGDEETGELADPSFIDAAFEAMELEQHYSFFQPRQDEITAWEYFRVCLVRSERNKFHEFKQQEQERIAKANQGK